MNNSLPGVKWKYFKQIEHIRLNVSYMHQKCYGTLMTCRRYIETLLNVCVGLFGNGADSGNPVCFGA
jgi:hypothetical protein